MRLHEVITGRTGLGVPYANVLRGSVVVRSFCGVTRGHATRRAERQVEKLEAIRRQPIELRPRPEDLCSASVSGMCLQMAEGGTPCGELCERGLRCRWPKGSRYATGGVIPDSGDRSDSVPAVLNPGCGYFPDPARPSAQHVEITALADLPDRVCLCGARWRDGQAHP